MRCTQCGLPLSPSRNNCPRCGTPINIANPARAESPSPSASAPTPQMPFPAPQESLASFEDRRSVPPAEPTQQANMQDAFPIPRPASPPASQPTNNQVNRSGPPHTRKPSRSTRSSSKTITIGLTSAALCIIAGSLLLVFVFLIEQGILPAGTTSTSDTQQANVPKAHQTATAAHLAKPTPPSITPTPTLPGQDLLDIAVLSNDFNSTQPLTDFKINQKIYVVFSLHPGGNSRTACLNWYLNDQLVNKFAFEVNPASNYHYYSYTILTTAGSGHVDISLSSTSVCTNAIMAKMLPFTVSQ